MDTKCQSTLFVFLLVTMDVTAVSINASDANELPDEREEQPELCIRGQYLDIENGVCKPCPFDHFMPDALHSQIRCYPCRHARPDSSEIDLVACSDTYDTIIGCKDGWFLREVPDYESDSITCYACTQCNVTSPPSYELRRCGILTDTVCCPLPNMVAVRKDGHPTYSCQHRSVPATDSNALLNDKEHTDPLNQHVADDIIIKTTEGSTEAIYKHDDKNLLLCGPDQFLKNRGGGKEKTCEKCPDGWYMPQNRHTNIQCLPRDEKRELERETNFFIGLTVLSSFFAVLFVILAYQCYRRKKNESIDNIDVKKAIHDPKRGSFRAFSKKIFQIHFCEHCSRNEYPVSTTCSPLIQA